MLSNHIKAAWRNLLKQKQFTFLNLLGLSSGLACVILIFLWVNDEIHIDKFNRNNSRLYQVLKNSPDGDGSIITRETTQGLLSQELVKSYPEIEYAVSVKKEGELGVLSVDQKLIKASWEFADKDFFHVFSYRLIEGNASRILADPYGVLVSDKLARKLFNTTKNIIGKTISWDAGSEFSGSYTISGIFEAPPTNASDQFDLVFSYALYVEKEKGGMGDINFWGSNSICTYLLLKKGTDADQFSSKIRHFTKEKMKSLGFSDYWLKWEGDIFLQKYSDKYLYNHYENGKIAGGRIEYVNLFSVIALFILVIACINFMNLSTAKAAGRMKEIGVRKVVGASRRSLILQYMVEAMLMSFLSMILAILISSLLLPVFMKITGKQLSLQFDPGFVLSLLCIVFITGIIAGSYPAIWLSGFRPISILKDKLRSSTGESFIRKGLVIFQFTISVVLIIAVNVVYRQMQLVQTKNLGYEKNNIIRFPSEGKLNDKLESFLGEAKKIPGITDASAMNGDFFGRASHSGGGISWEGKDPGLGIEYYGVSGDYGFMELLGLKMKEGRSFSRKFGADSSSVIFNESAITAMGIKNPIGRMVSLWGHNKQIIGVVKDYHFQSLYKKVGPSFLEYSPNNNMVLIKIKAVNTQEVISNLVKLYKSFNNGLDMDYKFLDDDYQAMYLSEERVSALSKYFAAFAILISCLGLFGLAAFTAQKRQREISIRKVVGATANNIATMLSMDFLKLVMLAVLIAFPLGWLMMHEWLQRFAYRVNIGVGVFFIAGASIILITIMTISFQAIKAAIANPAKSLRNE